MAAVLKLIAFVLIALAATVQTDTTTAAADSAAPTSEAATPTTVDASSGDSRINSPTELVTKDEQTAVINATEAWAAATNAAAAPTSTIGTPLSTRGGGIIGDAIDDPFELTEWLIRPTELGNMVGLFITDDKNEPLFEVSERILRETRNKNENNSLAVGPLTVEAGKYYMEMLPEYYSQPPNPLVQFGLGALEQELTRSRLVAAEALKNKTGGTLDSQSRQQRVSSSLEYFQPLNVIVPVLHAYTLAQQAPSNVNETCFNDLKHALHNLYQANAWAIKMFDAWGKVPAGVLNGNINWIGSYDLCLAVSAPDGMLTLPGWNISSTQGFKGAYCDVNFEIPESLGLPKAPGTDLFLLYGACFPSTCKSRDVKIIMESLSLFGVKLPKIASARCHSEFPLQSGQLKYDTAAIVTLNVSAAIVVIVIFCTILDGVFLRDDDEDEKQKSSELPTSNGQVNEGFASGEVGAAGVRNDVESSFIATGAVAKEAEALSGSEAATQKQDSLPPPPSGAGAALPGPAAPQPTAPAPDTIKSTAAAPGFGTKLIKSISLYTNLPALMAMEVRPSTLRGMDAIRYLSMCWIILGHCYSMGAAFVPSSLANLLTATTIMKDFAFQAIYSGPFAVDSFFCLSGTLVAYVFFKELSKAKGRLSPVMLIMFYVHRFIRILPLYGFMILLMATLGKYWGEGPLFDWKSNYITGCVNNWWTNLLFVNNFVNSRDMCLSWTWYLSNDMQFYWVSPIILIPLYYSPVIGGIIMGVCFVAHFIVTGILWSASEGRNYLNDADVYYNAYIKPYCRIGPYLVGILLGVLLHKKYKLPTKSLALAGWATAVFFVGLIVYIQYDENQYGELTNVWSTLERTLFETFSRTLFAIGVAWTIYAVHNGYAGVVGKVLSWGGWQPLGRLTYAAFLVHPMLLFLFIGNRRDLFYLTNFTITWIFCGYMVIAYAASTVLALMVELPFAGVERSIYGLFGFKSAA